MIVRRPTPSSLAASVNDSPSALRHSAKSAPVIGCCSSAIRRSVVAETSKRPTLSGQARILQGPLPRFQPWQRSWRRPSAVRNACCGRSVRSCRVPGRAVPRRTRTRRERAPIARTFVTLAMSSFMPVTFGIQSTSPITRPDVLLPSGGPVSGPCWAHLQPAIAVRDTRIFPAKSEPLMCTCGGFSS